MNNALNLSKDQIKQQGCSTLCCDNSYFGKTFLIMIKPEKLWKIQHSLEYKY